MASEFWEWFAGQDTPDDSDTTDETTADNEDKPAAFVYPSKEELWEQLHHACATAKRLHGTHYYARAHRFVDDILYDLEEIRGR